MNHPRRLMTRTAAGLSTALLLTTFFAAGAAQAAERKVMVENFTATW